MAVNMAEGVALLRNRGIALASPLSANELLKVERRWGFSFGADHAEMLRLALPVGHGWPNWRKRGSKLDASLAWPVESVLLDVYRNLFWLDGWGPRPVRTQDAMSVAHAQLSRWPKPVPIYSYRYMTEGSASGAPVLSIYQTDGIVYGLTCFTTFTKNLALKRRSTNTRPTSVLKSLTPGTRAAA